MLIYINYNTSVIRRAIQFIAVLHMKNCYLFPYFYQNTTFFRFWLFQIGTKEWSIYIILLLLFEKPAVQNNNIHKFRPYLSKGNKIYRGRHLALLKQPGNKFT